MALFFFHFSDGTDLTADESGLDLASVELTYLEARETALQMWPELVHEGVNPLLCYFEITNVRGELLIRFDFSELTNAGAANASRPSPSLELMCLSIAETHRRAQDARADLNATMGDTRRSLEEAKRLISQLAG